MSTSRKQTKTESHDYRFHGKDYPIRPRGNRWQADFGRVNGKRIMKSWKTIEESENWLREQVLLHEDQGAAAFQLTDAERLDAVKGRDILKDVAGLPKPSMLESVAQQYKEARALMGECKATFMDCVRYYMRHKLPAGELKTVNAVMQEYIQDGKERNLRPRSIQDVIHRLQRFAAVYGDKLVNEITRNDADNFIRSLEMTNLSKRHYRTVIGGMFSHCIEKDYVQENPFQAKTKHRRQYIEDEIMPECLSWRNVEKIMRSAVENEESMVAPMAIGFFAGLRTSELTHIDWKDIDLQSRKITVMPEVAKKRRARHVDIEDNLLAWLAPYKQASGFVAPQGQKWRARFDKVRTAAKITEWPTNAMRHSFASHHLVKYGDPVKTAFQLGHNRDTSMLFEHYRAMVKAEEADKYWSIKPSTEAKEIPFAAIAS